jgi:FMN phosphatase YigB (HAD superfamily)
MIKKWIFNKSSSPDWNKIDSVTDFVEYVNNHPSIFFDEKVNDVLISIERFVSYDLFNYHELYLRFSLLITSQDGILPKLKSLKKMGFIATERYAIPNKYYLFDIRVPVVDFKFATRFFVGLTLKMNNFDPYVISQLDKAIARFYPEKSNLSDILLIAGNSGVAPMDLYLEMFKKSPNMEIMDLDFL